MHDEAELLLRDVGLGPDLAFLRQEHAADQRRQLLVARRHLLQRRIGIGEAQRAGAAVVGAVRVDLGMDAAVDDMVENVVLQEIDRGIVVLVGLDDQLRQPMRMLAASSRYCRR